MERQRTATATFEVYTKRIEYLRRFPEFAKKLEGWRYLDDLDMDSMFFASRKSASRAAA
jgi:hypothetical protein